MVLHAVSAVQRYNERLDVLLLFALCATLRIRLTIEHNEETKPEFFLLCRGSVLFVFGHLTSAFFGTTSFWVFRVAVTLQVLVDLFALNTVVFGMVQLCVLC